MKYTFIITSTINATFGLIDNKTRYEQTIESIESIRNKVPHANIILIDSSISPMSEDQLNKLKEKLNLFVSLSDHPTCNQFNQYQLKSPGECLIMMVALNVIEENNILSDRIFKLNGRYKLMDEFNIIDYENIELKDKYVFKKKGNSWMGEGKYVFDTRLWSFDYSLLKETKEMLPKVMDLLLSKSFDLENAYYQLLDLDKVVEFDKVHVVGQIASDGRIQYD